MSANKVAIAVLLCVAVVVMPMAIAQQFAGQQQAPRFGQNVKIVPTTQVVLKTGSIDGQVLDPEGKGVPGIEVLVQNDRRETIERVRVDQEGRFAVEIQTPGTYYFSAADRGGEVEVSIQNDAQPHRIALFVQDGGMGMNIVGALGIVAVAAGITLGTLAIIDNNNGSVDIFGLNNGNRRSSSSSSASPLAVTPVLASSSSSSSGR